MLPDQTHRCLGFRRRATGSGPPLIGGNTRCPCPQGLRGGHGIDPGGGRGATRHRIVSGGAGGHRGGARRRGGGARRHGGGAPRTFEEKKGLLQLEVSSVLFYTTSTLRRSRSSSAFLSLLGRRRPSPPLRPSRRSS
jgi:hypothetical protein